MASTLLAVTLVLFLIFVSSWFARLLGQVAAGFVQADAIFVLLGLRSVDALMVLLPLAFFLSVLLAFGRLYNDCEMTAMLACGVSLLRITRFVFWFGLGFSIIVGAISLYFGPAAKAERYELQDEMLKNSGLEAIAAGQFRALADGKVVFYAERLSDDGKFMENVFIQGQRDDSLNLMVAARGYQRDTPEGRRYLVLQDGYRYEGAPGETDFRIIRYREHEILISKKELVLAEDVIAAMSSRELWNSDQLRQMAELQWRMSMPVSVVLLALLAVFLSRTTPRQGRYGKFFFGILVYVIYSNLLGVARTWVEHGKINPMIGIWWVHALLLLVVVVLTVQHTGGLKVLFASQRQSEKPRA